MGGRRAIRNTLRRLGMQAGNGEVVADLAALGIRVTEELVRQVRVEMLKEAGSAERRRAKHLDRCKRQPGRRPSKVPPRR